MFLPVMPEVKDKTCTSPTTGAQADLLEQEEDGVSNRKKRAREGDGDMEQAGKDAKQEPVRWVTLPNPDAYDNPMVVCESG